MKQKNYLVIGGTGGIGRAIVKELLQRTANVADEKLFTPAYSAARLLAVLDSTHLPNLVVLSIGQVSRYLGKR
ncbi:hypothetical protein [Psychrobacter celer]|uniref:hypothetical protein n=1 Tax=Psychrobacter celer TaxID=306572 RepID=UPI003FD134DF